MPGSGIGPESFYKMEILIRNMVCRHCVAAVSRIFDSLGLNPVSVELGKAVIEAESLPADVAAELSRALEAEGFGIIADADDALVEKVKAAVLAHVRDEDECRLNLSACLENRIGVSYDTLSRVFSAKEGRTVEKYHQAQKIERVKELMDYNEMTLSEIADAVGYSSVAHLSRRFREATGMTPTAYMKQPHGRLPLNEV